jgi:rhodanese-related sulfurtransferase
MLMEQIMKSKSMSRVSKSALRSMISRIEMLPVTAGETIYRQGESGETFYIIGAGKCRLFTYPSAGGAVVELGTLGPGDTFGEDSLIRGTARSFSVEMVTDGTLACLTKEEFDKLFREPMLKPADINEAKNLEAYGASIIDVRPPSEFKRYAVGGSRNVPVNEVRRERRGFDKQLTYITVSDNDMDSALAAFLLAQKGLEVRYLTATVADYMRACATDELDALHLPGATAETVIEIPEEYLSATASIATNVNPSTPPPAAAASPPEGTPGGVAAGASQPEAVAASDAIGAPIREELARMLKEHDAELQHEMHVMRVKIRGLLTQYQNRILELERKVAELQQAGPVPVARAAANG